MNPVQYIIADHTLNMPAGKLAAQAAHASVEGLRLNAKTTWGNPWDASIVNRWYQGGHYAKVVLEAADLLLVERYLNDRGFVTALILDEGRTVFDGGLTPTAIGLPVLDKDSGHVKATFGEFKLYGAAAQAEVNKARLRQEFERPQRRPKPDPTMSYAKRPWWGRRFIDWMNEGTYDEPSERWKARRGD